VEGGERDTHLLQWSQEAGAPLIASDLWQSTDEDSDTSVTESAPCVTVSSQYEASPETVTSLPDPTDAHRRWGPGSGRSGASDGSGDTGEGSGEGGGGGAKAPGVHRGCSAGERAGEAVGSRQGRRRGGKGLRSWGGGGGCTISPPRAHRGGCAGQCPAWASCPSTSAQGASKCTRRHLPRPHETAQKKGCPFDAGAAPSAGAPGSTPRRRPPVGTGGRTAGTGGRTAGTGGGAAAGGGRAEWRGGLLGAWWRTPGQSGTLLRGECGTRCYH